jgi:hypothetical protein
MSWGVRSWSYDTRVLVRPLTFASKTECAGAGVSYLVIVCIRIQAYQLQNQGILKIPIQPFPFQDMTYIGARLYVLHAVILRSDPRM